MTRTRSPNFPGVSLEEAVRMIEQIHGAEAHQHPIPVKVILGHLGYKPRSGRGLVVVAALGQFGFLEFEGKGPTRSGRITDLALDVVLPGSPHRSEQLKVAALNPRLHADIWDEFAGKLPTDTTLRFRLVRERKFTERGADGFIKQFRSTIDFANLTESEAGVDDPEEKTADSNQTGPKKSELSRSDDKNRDLTIPLPGGRMAILKVPARMSEIDHSFLEKYLEIMKDALITEQSASPCGRGADERVQES